MTINFCSNNCPPETRLPKQSTSIIAETVEGRRPTAQPHYTKYYVHTKSSTLSETLGEPGSLTHGELSRTDNSIYYNDENDGANHAEIGHLNPKNCHRMTHGIQVKRWGKSACCVKGVSCALIYYLMFTLSLIAHPINPGMWQANTQQQM